MINLGMRRWLHLPRLRHGASILGVAILTVVGTAGVVADVTPRASVTSTSEGLIAEESVIRQVNEIIAAIEDLEREGVRKSSPSPPERVEDSEQGTIRRLRSELGKAEVDRAESAKDLRKAQSGLIRTASELEQARKSQRKTAADLTRLRWELAAEQARSRAAESSARKATAELEKDRKHHQKALAMHKDELSRVGNLQHNGVAELEKLQEEIRMHDAARVESKKALAAVRAELDKGRGQFAGLEAEIKRLKLAAEEADVARERADRQSRVQIEALEDAVALARRRAKSLEGSVNASAMAAIAPHHDAPEVPREFEREEELIEKQAGYLARELERTREEINSRQKKMAGLLNGETRNGDGWLARRARGQRSERIAREEQRLDTLQSTEGKLVSEMQVLRTRREKLSQAVDSRTELAPANEATADGADGSASAEQGQEAKWQVTLRPGLILSVTVAVLGNAEIDAQVARIDPGGFAELPLVGQVKTKDLTVRALTDQLTEAYGVFYRHPSVNVDFVVDDNDSATFPWGYVTVLGRIRSPGRINMPPSQQLTLSMAIQAAGGFDTSAKTKAIRITRKDEAGEAEAITVNMKNLGRSGASEGDIQLLNGDTVYIPERIL